MTEAPPQQPNSQFMIQRIYIKDLSFEAPNLPQIFTLEWKPQLDLNINIDINTLEQDLYEIVLNLTVTVQNQQMVAFLIEIKQAGIFSIQGVPADQLAHLLNSFCPNILYPYAREAITSQVARGGFPQLVLAPINFDALYAQKLEQQPSNEVVTD